MVEELTQLDPELQMLLNNKQSGFNYRKRREEDWLENYTLYRDKVTINRLTQRQSVNIPLMKQTVRTLLKDVDDLPVLYFENLDNDKEKEIFQNGYWELTGDKDHNNFELLDIIDKRQVFLFGRSFDQWQIANGQIKVIIQDPQDILVSRYTDPTNIHTSRFLIHTHIFKTLAELENNPDYDQQAVKRLKTWYGTEMGIIKVASNQEMAVEKNKKMEEMGVPDVDSPVLGETIVELTMHFIKRQEKDEDEQIWLYVEVDDREIIMKKPLEEVIGTTEDHFWRTHFPYNSWADDIERQDFWSDGIGDMVRTPNKILNSWFSQLVENRTLRNFGMHYYDSTVEGFMPSSFNPVHWGWYGVPGKPQDVLQKVDIPDLSESLDEMKFLLEVNEKATGATATQQGVQTERQVTLGEVQLALGEAKERVKGMSKFYTTAWQQRGRMFLKLIEAAHGRLEAVKIYKKGRNTDKLFEREVSPKDWMTKSGYREKVWSQDEKKSQDSESIQKLNAAVAVMPDNPKLLEVYQRKLLQFSDLTPEEITSIMEYEQQKREQILNQIQAGGMMGQPMGQQPMPTQPTMPIQR